jgi:hypothetical protein
MGPHLVSLHSLLIFFLKEKRVYAVSCINLPVKLVEHIKSKYRNGFILLWNCLLLKMLLHVLFSSLILSLQCELILPGHSKDGHCMLKFYLQDLDM